MSAKKNVPVPEVALSANQAPGIPTGMFAGKSPAPVASRARTAGPPQDLLVVCLQDPFDAVGDSSSIVHTEVPTAGGNTAHCWKLEAVMEMNPPRFFKGWATCGSFTLDLSVHGAAFPATGTWADSIRTTSGSGKCQVIITRDSSNKIRFSLASVARHATERPMPSPDETRFLNADIGIKSNGSNGLSAGAVAVVSNRSWSRLIAASSVTTQGMAFDGKWRQKLDSEDGDATVMGEWAFALMTREDYEAHCQCQGRPPVILDEH
jgi:hypothetical protein